MAVRTNELYFQVLPITLTNEQSERKNIIRISNSYLYHAMFCLLY